MSESWKPDTEENKSVTKGQGSIIQLHCDATSRIRKAMKKDRKKISNCKGIGAGR